MHRCGGLGTGVPCVPGRAAGRLNEKAGRAYAYGRAGGKRGVGEMEGANPPSQISINSPISTKVSVVPGVVVWVDSLLGWVVE